MDRSKPKEFAPTTGEEKQRVREMVVEALGEVATLEYDLLPKNVGVKGDERVLGDSPLITLDVDDPAKFVADNYEVLEQLANELTNEVHALTRVIVEITPKNATPTFLLDQSPHTLEAAGRSIEV